MGLHEAHDRELLEHYEGLIFKTARLLVGVVEDEVEDIQQVLRIKVWRALLAYDPERSKLPRDNYVFSCLMNQKKDLIKKRRLNILFIEDVAPAPAGGDEGNFRRQSRDKFEDRYLSAGHDQVFGAVEDDDVLVPSTLTQLERKIVVLLYRDYRQQEIAAALDLPKKQLEKAMRSVRAKMADWRPTPEEPTADELPEPTPLPARQDVRSRAA